MGWTSGIYEHQKPFSWSVDACGADREVISRRNG